MSNIPRHAIIGNEAHALVYVNPQELAALHATRKGKKPVMHNGIPAFPEGGDADSEGAGNSEGGIGSGGATGSGTGADIGNYGIDSGSIGVNQDVSPVDAMTSQGYTEGPQGSASVGSIEGENNPAVMPHLSQFPVDMQSYMAPYGTPGNPPLSENQKAFMGLLSGPRSISQIGTNLGIGMVTGPMGSKFGPGALAGLAMTSHAKDYAKMGDAAFSPDKMSYDSSAAAGLSSTGQTSGGGDAFENTPFYGTESQADLSKYKGWGVLSPDRIGQSAQLKKEAEKRRALSGATIALERYNPIYWTKSKTK